MTTSIEDVLDRLGVRVVSSTDREIKALCPVHHLVTGRADNHPSWYMNQLTGAWLCFSCGQRGSLEHLVDLMGFDEEVLERVPVEIMRSKVERWAQEAQDEVLEDTTQEAETETVYVSNYAFNKNPLPPPKPCERRGFTQQTCDLFNVRWDAKGKCFLIPVYDFTGQLIGWQEKATGYFNNVPEGMKKRNSLFGYQLHTGRQAIIVESPLDVLRLYELGFTGGLATYGSYVANEQVDAIAALVGTAILAFDDDSAGEEAATSVAKMLDKRGVNTKFFRYPHRKHEGWGKDPGDLADDLVGYGMSHASFIRRT